MRSKPKKVSMFFSRGSRRGIMNKRGGIMQLYLIQIFLAALFVILFLMATAQKADSRGVKQQVLEKQIALLIDSASPGMSFSVDKIHLNGHINGISIREGRVFVDVNGLASLKGYSYFTRYSIRVREYDDKFVIEVK